MSAWLWAHPGAALIAIVIAGFTLAGVILRWQDARRVIRRTQAEHDEALIDQAIALTAPPLPQRHPARRAPDDGPFLADGLDAALKQITKEDK